MESSHDVFRENQSRFVKSREPGINSKPISYLGHVCGINRYALSNYFPDLPFSFFFISSLFGNFLRCSPSQCATAGHNSFLQPEQCHSKQLMQVTQQTKMQQNIPRIFQGSLNVEIVVLNCHKCNQCIAMSQRPQISSIPL